MAANSPDTLLVSLDEYVIMPNHIHGILVLRERVGATRRRCRAILPARVAPTDLRHHGPIPGTLGAIIGQFKSAATKRVNVLRGAPHTPLWQRNFHEHIIRGDKDLTRIRDYIASNPPRWSLDEETPSRI